MFYLPFPYCVACHIRDTMTFLSYRACMIIIHRSIISDLAGSFQSPVIPGGMN